MAKLGSEHLWTVICTSNRQLHSSALRNCITQWKLLRSVAQSNCRYSFVCKGGPAGPYISVLSRLCQVWIRPGIYKLVHMKKIVRLVRALGISAFTPLQHTILNCTIRYVEIYI